MDVLSRFPERLYWDDLSRIKRQSYQDQRDVFLFPEETQKTSFSFGLMNNNDFVLLKTVPMKLPSQEEMAGVSTKLKNKSHRRVSVLVEEWELLNTNSEGIEFDVFRMAKENDSLVFVPKNAKFLGYREFVLEKKGTEQDTVLLRDLHRCYGLVAAKILMEENGTQVKCDIMDTMHQPRPAPEVDDETGEELAKEATTTPVKTLPHFYVSPLLDSDGYTFTQHQVQVCLSNHCLDATPIVHFRDWRQDFKMIREVPHSVMEEIFVAKFLNYDLYRFRRFLKDEMKMSQFEIESLLTNEGTA